MHESTICNPQPSHSLFPRRPLGLAKYVNHSDQLIPQYRLDDGTLIRVNPHFSNCEEKNIRKPTTTWPVTLRDANDLEPLI